MQKNNKSLLVSSLTLVFVLIFGGLLTFILDLQSYFPLFAMISLMVWSLTIFSLLFDQLGSTMKWLIVSLILLALSLALWVDWFGFAGFLLTFYGVWILLLTFVTLSIQYVFKRTMATKWLTFGVVMVLIGSSSI